MRLNIFNVLVGSLLLATAPAIAQTTAPGSAAPATTGGGMGWLWFVLLLIIIGAAVWYFAVGRNKLGGTRSMSPGSPATGTSSMGIDRDRVAGSAQQAKGSIKEGVGSVLGDGKLQAEGKLDKAEGKAQNTVGGIKDTLKGR